MFCSIAIAAQLVAGQVYSLEVVDPKLCWEGKATARIEQFAETRDRIKDADVYTDEFYRLKFVSPCSIRLDAVVLVGDGRATFRPAETEGKCTKGLWYGF